MAIGFMSFGGMLTGGDEEAKEKTEVVSEVTSIDKNKDNTPQKHGKYTSKKAWIWILFKVIQEGQCRKGNQIEQMDTYR